MAYVDLQSIDYDYVIGDTEERMQALAGNDEILGSLYGGSLWARCMGGDDFVQLHSGWDNYVNGNMGNDTIRLFDGGGGDANVLGGRDNDTIDVVSGFWGWGEGSIINGNQGNDILNNWGTCPQLRGGAGNDIITNNGGSTDVWGDSGADIFVPYAIDVNGNWGGIMAIMDFNAYEGDILDVTRMGTYNKLHYDSNGDGLIDTGFSHVNGPLCCLVYSAIL